MTVPANCWQVTWVFPLNRVGTIEDVAEFSMWFDGGSLDPGDPQLASIAAGSIKAWKDHMPEPTFSTAVELHSCIARTFLPNGHTLREQVVVDDTPWQGSATDASMPWETSLCVSLYTYTRGTFVSNGRRKRGRIYLPPMHAALLDPSNSGYFSDAGLSAFFGHCTDFLRDAGQDQEGVKVGDLSVFSRVDSELRHVTQLTVDAKFDSQRRRQNRETAGVLQVAY